MEKHNNSMITRIIFLIIGLIFNAMGNGLTIASNFGSGIWTASAVNFSNTFHISIGIIIFTLGVINALTNQILLKKIEIIRFIKEIAYVTFFSYGINMFTKLFSILNVGGHGSLISALFSILGITILGCSISLNQRSNIWMHPNDGTTNLLRFNYLKGSALASQLLDMLAPVLIIIICVIISKRIDAVNIGTIYQFLGNGFIIKYADRLIAPKLVHNVNNL